MNTNFTAYDCSTRTVDALKNYILCFLLLRDRKGRRLMDRASVIIIDGTAGGDNSALSAVICTSSFCWTLNTSGKCFNIILVER